MGDVIKLRDQETTRAYPRRLFACASCGSSSFKLFRWMEEDGLSDIYLECANCEEPTNFVTLDQA